MTDQVEFDRVYRQRIDALSIATVEQLLEDLALQNAAEGLVLCCLEDLRTGRFFVTGRRSAGGSLSRPASSSPSSPSQASKHSSYDHQPELPGAGVVRDRP